MSNKGRELYEFGPFRLDPFQRVLLRDSLPVPLQLKAFETLLVLVRNSEQVVLKDDLMKAVWPDTFVEESNLAQNIFVLRKTLGVATGDQRYIDTIPGRGYRFAQQVRTVRDREELPAPASIEPQAAVVAAAAENRRHRPWVWLCAVTVIAVMAGMGYWRVHAMPKLRARDNVVLADFANSTGDKVFDGTLRQGLAAQLEQSPFLNLVSDQRTVQTLALMAQPKDTRITPELGRQVCQRTASSAVIEGSIAQVGTEYLLVLKAVNCANGDILASVETQAADRNRVLDAIGKMAAEIRNRLGESLASVHQFDTAPEEVTTASLEALQAYSLGSRVMITRNDYPAAIPLFQQAISLDPSFAMAYARVGINYYNLDEPARAAENLKKAYNLKERVSERERLYIAATHDAMATGDMEAARRTFEVWQQLYPQDQFAVGNLGVVDDFLGEHGKALVAFQEARKLNPGNALVFSNVVAGYYHNNRFDEARATAAQADALHLNSNFLDANLYMVDFLQDDKAGMAKRVETLAGKPGWEDLIFYRQSDTAAYHGRLSEALAFTRHAIDSAERSDKKETAAAYGAESAVREALAGDFHLAEKQAKDALSLSNGKEVEALSAIALGVTGNATETAKLERDLNGRFPQDTVVQANLLPTIRLADGLHAGDTAKLTRALALPAPYELGEISNSVTFCMYSSYFRGDSYLASGDGTAAAAEFQKIIDHPGLVRNGMIGSLAHLGLGRAYVKTRDVRKAKAAYQDFFTLWKDADPSVPILRQAKAEYSKLE